MSLAGVPELSRTTLFGIPTATLPAASFVGLDSLITFHTAIRITENAGTHQGLIFEVGDATTAVAAWVDDDQIGFRAGDAAAADRALASFSTGTGELPVGRVFDLVLAVRPGTGLVRVWDHGRELARDAASGGSFPNGWAAASDGAFAAAASGALPADVVRTGAPAGFEVIRPLSVFLRQAPQHFV